MVILFSLWSTDYKTYLFLLLSDGKLTYIILIVTIHGKKCLAMTAEGKTSESMVMHCNLGMGLIMPTITIILLHIL
jgi:hypothetical protein